MKKRRSNVPKRFSLSGNNYQNDERKRFDAYITDLEAKTKVDLTELYHEVKQMKATINRKRQTTGLPTLPM